jgi:hypothetical protein
MFLLLQVEVAVVETLEVVAVLVDYSHLLLNQYQLQQL